MTAGLLYSANFELNELTHEGLFNFVDGAFTIEFDVFEASFRSQIFIEVCCCNSTSFVIVVDVVAFVDCIFVLVISALGESTAAYATFVSVGLDSVDELVVGVVRIVFAEATAHDAVLATSRGSRISITKSSFTPSFSRASQSFSA